MLRKRVQQRSKGLRATRWAEQLAFPLAPMILVCMGPLIALVVTGLGTVDARMRAVHYDINGTWQASSPEGHRSSKLPRGDQSVWWSLSIGENSRCRALI